MIGATLDVNVLVSAAISARGIPYQLLLAWQDQRFLVITSDHITSQPILKLRSDKLRRYGLTTAAIRAFTAPLTTDARVVIVPPAEVRPVTGDPEDDAVLATARLGGARYLVTGDRGLLDRSSYEGIEILTPRAFLDRLQD